MARAKGTGRLFKRNGLYYFRTRINGNEKTIALNTDDEEKAREEADKQFKNVLQAEHKEEIAAHVAIARRIVKENKSIELSSVWETYKNNHSRPDSSAGTLGNYERMWKKFEAWIKAKYPVIDKINQITVEIAQEYAGHLWDTPFISPKTKKKILLTANTFNYHMQALALVSRVLFKQGGLEINPWKNIQRKTEDKQGRKDFSKSEVLKLFAKFDEPDFALRNKKEMRLLFYVGAFTGLRLVDAAKITWSSIDFVKNNITCKPVKTRNIQREVYIPVHPAFREELLKAPREKDAEYVMPGVAHRYDTDSSGLDKDILKVLDACGLNKKVSGSRGKARNLYGFHSFRHFFASTCAAAGVPVTTLAEILGDNIATLQKYYMHSQDEGKRQVLQALPGMAVNKNEALLSELIECMRKADAKTLKAVEKLLKNKEKPRSCVLKLKDR